MPEQPRLAWGRNSFDKQRAVCAWELVRNQTNREAQILVSGSLPLDEAVRINAQGKVARDDLATKVSRVVA